MSKFGVPNKQIPETYREILTFNNIKLVWTSLPYPLANPQGTYVMDDDNPVTP
jgi:hypothetical protein